MKPANLWCHLETKHAEYKSKSLDFFKNKLRELKISRKTITKHCGANINENATLASYEVAQLVAKCGKNHTIAEELILPSAIILCKRMLGDAAAKITGTVPLSNNTVQRQITEMAVNVEETLLARLCMSDMYALHLYESTDILKKKHNVGFRMILMGGPSLPTDGAKSMAGKKTGLLAHIKAVAPEVKWTYCCIHREGLVAKRLSEPLQKILNEDRTWTHSCESALEGLFKAVVADTNCTFGRSFINY
ncbi:SCAN domain-containing protein 3-like [Schistocerca serialis cubense]|uniref:SCAN domain-containing protein 3-like n=1 Tax=Schistocerca serialis cubense TaxID=2023355 RepID=UPI00214F1E23|nr:SCAN domain-containing protein 3-like [Schistocerca serialis cubense]